ncbi:MAG: glycosyltransferase family 2 protein [Pyrinomonadaceae bacterium]
MCTYNGARYVLEQLESLASQTRVPDELIVCDDGSTDETVQILSKFALSVSFPVRIQLNQQNVGLIKNFERAIALCDGDIIALCDQDDVWRPEKLARLEAIFAATPDAGLVFSDAELVDDALRPLGRRLSETVGSNSAQRKLRHREKAFRLLLPGCLVTGATMAFRTHHRSLTLPIPEDIAMIHDGWIALMVSAVARVFFIEEPLMFYRQHDAQQIGAKPKKKEKVAMQTVVRRVTSYAELLKIIERAKERLLLQGEVNTDIALRELETVGAHLRKRAHLPESWLRRLPLVLHELLTLRYHRYGKGMFSAAKDLLR